MGPIITALLTILFLVALIVPRKLPIIKNVKYPRLAAFAMWILSTFIVAAALPTEIGSSANNSAQTVVTQEESKPVASAPASENNSAVKPAVTAASDAEKTPEVKASRWAYDEDKDEMRNSTSYFARNSSLNDVELAFPYSGGTTASILLRKSPKFGNDALISVNKGQITCSYSNCYVSVKFDDKPIMKFSASRAENGSSEVIFINDAVKFASNLKKSKTAIVEVQFFDHGSEQFKFEVDQLQWKHF